MELTHKKGEDVVKQLGIIYEKVSNPTCVQMLAEMEAVGVSQFFADLYKSVASNKGLTPEMRKQTMSAADSVVSLACSCLLFNLFLKDRDFMEYAITEEALLRHQSEVREEFRVASEGTDGNV